MKIKEHTPTVPKLQQPSSLRLAKDSVSDLKRSLVMRSKHELLAQSTSRPSSVKSRLSLLIKDSLEMLKKQDQHKSELFDKFVTIFIKSNFYFCNIWSGIIFI